MPRAPKAKPIALTEIEAEMIMNAIGWVVSEGVMKTHENKTRIALVKKINEIYPEVVNQPHNAFLLEDF